MTYSGVFVRFRTRWLGSDAARASFVTTVGVGLGELYFGEGCSPHAVVPAPREQFVTIQRAMVARSESMFGCYDSYSYRLWSLANVWSGCHCK